LSEFELKLMDIDSDHLGIPDTEYQSKISLPAGEFARICRDLGVIGDTVSIHATKESVKFAVSGDLGAGSITCKQFASEKESESTTIQLNDEVELKFALRYLNSFAKAAPLADQVTLNMSPDVPLMVEFVIAGKGHVRFYLAPKINQDEDSASAE
jgi:proliferating cell nuclear antigen